MSAPQQLALLTPIQALDPAGAVLSPCGLYRYLLWRQWDGAKPWVVFVMLNPSNADARATDPTLRLCIRIARAWGFGGLWIVNLYGYRTPHPKELEQAPDPVGPDNDRHLREYLKKAPTVVCGWGAYPGTARPQREAEVLRMMTALDVEPVVLGLTKVGQPIHPRATLYGGGNGDGAQSRPWTLAERQALMERKRKAK